jgi:hypothetical protein
MWNSFFVTVCSQGCSVFVEGWYVSVKFGQVVDLKARILLTQSFALGLVFGSRALSQAVCWLERSFGGFSKS